jgi:hypothetical protein
VKNLARHAFLPAPRLEQAQAARSGGDSKR